MVGLNQNGQGETPIRLIEFEVISVALGCRDKQVMKTTTSGGQSLLKLYQCYLRSVGAMRGKFIGRGRQEPR